MTTINIDTVPSVVLANAADTNFVVHASWAPRQNRDMHVLTESGLVLVDSGLPCDTFNVICCARLTAEQAPPCIRKAIAYFQSVGRPFSWWGGPADQPSDLGNLLAEAGLAQAESVLAMAADLTDLPRYDLSPGGLEIRRVQTQAELSDFADVVASNWTPPDPSVQRFYTAAASALLMPDCPQWLYVGYINGQPVSAAEGVEGGGVAGLYNICTREAHRRCGIGTAMTLQPLLVARERGIRTGVLQAVAKGVNIYFRLGFKLFGDITEYKLPAGSRRLKSERHI